MAKGIKDKVVILGMGCSKFGERWDKEADNLMVEAYTEAIADAGIDTKQIDAAWLSTAIEEQHVGKSAHAAGPGAAAAIHPGDAGSRTTAPAAPRRSAAPSMPSPRAPPTSRWRSASRSSRTPAMAACRSAAAARSTT